MNPTIPQSLIDKELKKDRSAAESEWFATFRQDVETFLSPDSVHNCVVPGRKVLPPSPNFSYVSFADPSGGKADAFSVCVAHAENEKVIIDCLKAYKPPFNPSEVVESISKLIRTYGLSSIVGDKYGASWVSEAFQKVGVNYQNSIMAKSDLYLNLEPKINTGMIELPEDDMLIKELLELERKTGRSGRDSVDHAPRESDDRANSVAGVASIAESIEDDEVYAPYSETYL